MKFHLKYFAKPALLGFFTLFLLLLALIKIQIMPNFWKKIILIIYYCCLVLFFIFTLLEIIDKNLNERSKSLFLNFIMYSFLLLTLIYLINNFYKITFFNQFKIELFFLWVILGFFTLYAKKEYFLIYLSKLDNKESSKNDFINKINLIIFIILIFAIIFIYTYRLGSYEFKEDEFQTVSAAIGYYHTGEFYEWDFNENKSGKYTNCIIYNIDCHYTRAWPHTWLISQSYKIFGISEWSSRIVSVVFGIFFLILSSIFIYNFFGTKKAVVVSLFSIALFPSFISTFRYTRMYALLISLFLLLVFVLYKALTEHNLRIKGKAKINIFQRLLDFNYFYLTLSLILLYLLYSIHINSLIILPATFLFVIYLAITRREPRYLLLLFIGIISILLILYLLIHTNKLIDFSAFLTFFKQKNTSYLIDITNYPFFLNLGFLILILGLSILPFMDKKRRDKIVYFYIIILSSLVFFIYIAKRYPGFLYISHVAGLSLILILTIYIIIIESLVPKKIKFIFYILLLVFSLYNYYNGFHAIYGINDNYGDYRVAYKEIINNYDIDKDVIFGQYLRTYYLQSLPINFTFIGMKRNKQYTLDEFLTELKKHNTGWIAWESRKGYHLRGEIRTYISKNFKKIHGDGLDNTKVEVYYFNKSMVK